MREFGTCLGAKSSTRCAHSMVHTTDTHAQLQTQVWLIDTFGFSFRLSLLLSMLVCSLFLIQRSQNMRRYLLTTLRCFISIWCWNDRPATHVHHQVINKKRRHITHNNIPHRHVRVATPTVYKWLWVFCTYNWPNIHTHTHIPIELVEIFTLKLMIFKLSVSFAVHLLWLVFNFRSISWPFDSCVCVFCSFFL